MSAQLGLLPPDPVVTVDDIHAAYDAGRLSPEATLRGLLECWQTTETIDVRWKKVASDTLTPQTLRETRQELVAAGLWGEFRHRGIYVPLGVYDVAKVVIARAQRGDQ